MVSMVLPYFSTKSPLSPGNSRSSPKAYAKLSAEPKNKRRLSQVEGLPLKAETTKPTSLVKLSTKPRTLALERSTDTRYATTGMGSSRSFFYKQSTFATGSHVLPHCSGSGNRTGDMVG